MEYQRRSLTDADIRDPGELDEVEAIKVFANFGGKRADGLYDSATDSIRLVDGALAGRTFRAPSGAAAVVRSMYPAVRPNREGWTFWWESETADILSTRGRVKR